MTNRVRGQCKCLEGKLCPFFGGRGGGVRRIFFRGFVRLEGKTVSVVRRKHEGSFPRCYVLKGETVSVFRVGMCEAFFCEMMCLRGKLRHFCGGGAGVSRYFP